MRRADEAHPAVFAAIVVLGAVLFLAVVGVATAFIMFAADAEMAMRELRGFHYARLARVLGATCIVAWVGLTAIRLANR